MSNTLYIHGGKTDPSNAYSYTSAPTTNDLLALDLSIPFALDAPPWRLLSGVEIPDGSQGPALAWHTLTAYSEDAILGTLSLPSAHAFLSKTTLSTLANNTSSLPSRLN